MFNQFLLLVLFVLTLSQQSIRVGGFTPITNISDQGLQVVNNYLKTKHTQLINTTIIKAERQIVSGLNYRIWYAFGNGGQYFAQINVPINGNVKEVSFIVNKMQSHKNNISNIKTHENQNQNIKNMLVLPVPINSQSNLNTTIVQTQGKLPPLPNLPPISILSNSTLILPTLKIEDLSSNINSRNSHNTIISSNLSKQRITVSQNSLITAPQLLLSQPTPFILFSDSLQKEQSFNKPNILTTKPLSSVQIQNTQIQIIHPQMITLLSSAYDNNKVSNYKPNSQTGHESLPLRSNILIQPTPFIYSQSQYQNELSLQMFQNQQPFKIKGCQMADRNKRLCILCQKGYILGTKGKCGKVDVLCLIYNIEDYTCKQCIRGYNYNGTRCHQQLI